jgi:hypothetical protein
VPENYCLTLREERNLRVSENRVLRVIFVAEKDWETIDCRRLHSGEIHDHYCWVNIVGLVKSRRMKWGGGDFGRYGVRKGVQCF